MDVNDFKIKKGQWLLYIVVSAGLLYITESWLMALGIMLLLILIDRMIAEYERKSVVKTIICFDVCRSFLTYTARGAELTQWELNP